MAYRIEYGPEIRNTYRGFGIRFQAMTAAFFLIFVLLASRLSAEGKGLLQRVLLPGGGEGTRTAFHGFVDDLKEGQPVMEAFTVFCETVVHEAMQSE